jgi:hypothetical protein
MHKDSGTQSNEGTTASEERRVAVVERGLRNGLAYSAAGLCTAVVGVFCEHPVDKYFVGGSVALLVRGMWVLVKTARRAERRRRKSSSSR